ncbi:MAG: hypothetical protein LBK95_19430 [Bifidobacteriaceae bacterium]|nr:hypothetical protein [Bifidobacteriaceae bacterium]
MSHGDGVGGINLCNYKAQNRGTRSGGSWSKTSSQTSGCVPVTAYVDMTVNLSFDNNSQFYGQMYHDGAWAPGSPAAKIKK